MRIACEASGDGPPVVLVHGAGSARWSFDLLRPHLEPSFTVIAIDRRGRGDSSDGEGYELEREFEDVAAVVRDAGEGAALVGHSYGGLVAAGAARLLDGLERLVLYEPPMGGVLATARDDRALGALDRERRQRPDGARVPARHRRLRRGRDRRARRHAHVGARAGAWRRACRASCARSWPTGSTRRRSRGVAMPACSARGEREPAWACARPRPTRTPCRERRRAFSRATATARTSRRPPVGRAELERFLAAE